MPLTEVDESIYALVTRRRDTLAEKNIDQLSNLDAHQQETLNMQGRDVIVSVWHDCLRGGEHRIVVQAYKAGALGTGQMFAVGFIAMNSGEQRDLTTEEWAPFS